MLPTLASAADQLARSFQGALYPEDEATFGLLVFQIDTGLPPPATAVAAALDRVQAQIPATNHWRLEGFRTFWAQFTNVNWIRYPLTASGFAAEFETYLRTKQTAERGAINQSIGGVVGSEQAWQNALGSWQAIEQRWYTIDQASTAANYAYRVSIDAQKVIEQTDTTLQSG